MPLTQISPSPLRLVRRILAGAILILVSAYVHAQTTSFTYQGRLTDSGTPANGIYDLQFALFDNSSAGTQIGSTLTRTGVSVSGGVFTVQLDFGTSAFPGANRFLEIGVRPPSVGSFTTLAPRQQISSTPYAIRTLSAATADTATTATTATNATQLGGVAASNYVQTNDSRLTDSRPPTAGSSNYIQNNPASTQSGSFNISGDGAAGGTLSGNAVNATTQYNIGSSRVLSTTGSGGFINLFVGPGAGEANTTGSGNVFVGGGAGQANTKGFNNSFVGVNAGRNNIGGDPSLLGSGTGNSFFGAYAGLSNTQGFANSFFGSQAGESNVTGLANAFFGFSAGQNNTVGGNNAFFGVNSGLRNTTGSFNTIIGSGADVGTGNLTNATAIGTGAVVSTSNTIVLGTSSDTVVAANRMRVTVIPPEPSVASVCFNPQGDLKQCGFSSLRFKQNVQPFRGGLDIVRRLRPITFDWKESGLPDIGLGAEEVAKVAPSFTFTNSKGEITGVKYERLDLLLINAVKEQQQQIERQQKQIATLSTSNAALNARLRGVEKALRKKVGSARRRR